ncbi:SlyX family protein [Desulfospira joergensenii]|uniref:SlyX family protein n=1 Tax=Desulfospira joergensenii TaxID=53329 RepID=UPI0004203AA7|nr:SlyX family protein [Desulfospira joergensenii]
MDENRLIDMETKLAYQEKIIKDLNDVVCEQQKVIEKLEAGYKKLTKLFNEQAKMVSGIEGPADEKPPHY